MRRPFADLTEPVVCPPRRQRSRDRNADRLGDARPRSCDEIRRPVILRGQPRLQSREDVPIRNRVGGDGMASPAPFDRASQAYSREGMVDTGPFAARRLGGRVLAPLLSSTAPHAAQCHFPACRPTRSGHPVCRQGIRYYGRLRIVQRTDSAGYDYLLVRLGRWSSLRPPTYLEAVAPAILGHPHCTST